MPLHWEVRHPCPPPEAASHESDPRIERAERQVQLWNQIVPEYEAMHELGARLPVECIQITAHEFRSEELMGRHQVPSYAAWYAGCDLAPAYRFHRAMLQHLAVAPPPRALGAEGALAPARRCATLFAVYPDARVVVTHRDPLEDPALGGEHPLLDGVRALGRGGSRGACSAGSPARRAAASSTRMTALRASGDVDPAQFHDVRYAELVARPHRDARCALRRTSGSASPAEAEARMRAYLAAKPKGKHGAHRYDFAATGFDLAAERERFRPYRERYGVDSRV